MSWSISPPPNSLHYAQTKAALLAGKNVLCEKPFVPTVAEADELIALAKEKHLFLFEAITTAHHPNYALAKQYLDDIGSLRIVSCTFCQYSSRYDALLSGQVPPVFDPACCGGALMDLNLYNVHFVVGLFGEPMLVSYHPNLYRNGIDTSGILLLEYPDFICQCTGAKDCAAPGSVQLIGDAGRILIEPGSSNCQKLRLFRPGQEDLCSEYSESPWFYEVAEIAMILALKDYDACYAALKKDPAGGHRSGSRPGGCTAGLLSFQPQMTNSLAFFALAKLARTIYNKDESLNS